MVDLARSSERMCAYEHDNTEQVAKNFS
jgi:hypothetical protein